MIPVINFLSKDGLFIFVIAILINILIAYAYPIIHSRLPSSVKSVLDSYNNVIVVHRQNIVASCIFAIVLVYATMSLAPVAEVFLQMNQQTQPSILNLAGLTKA